MSNEIIFCVNQEKDVIGYQFRVTNIFVFSFEEALYHCYHYWKQSLQDFVSEDFIRWVKKELKLYYIGNKISELKELEVLHQKYIQFLSVTDYFSKEQLETLQKEMIQWEQSLEWERLKQEGDFFVQTGRIQEGIGVYQKALRYGENPLILNNIGIAYLKIDKREEGLAFLSKAYAMAPEHPDVIYNYAKGMVDNHQWATVLPLIQKIENKETHYYLMGEIQHQQKKYIESVGSFSLAYKANPKTFYLYKITEVYTETNQQEKALETLAQINETAQDKEYFLRKSAVHQHFGEVATAIKLLEKANSTYPNAIDIWIRLSQYRRAAGDLRSAESAIAKALSLQENNEVALMEKAKIKKITGKTKEYHAIVRTILAFFRTRYRETNEG